MKFSVIIPTFNRADVLRRTLNLLAVQTLSDFEVVIVDDGSEDETLRLLTEFQRKGVLDLKFFTQKNAGAGAARNTAIPHTRGDILLFLGDDMLPQPTLLATHWNFHEKNPAENFACLGKVEWHSELCVSRFMRWLQRSGVQFKFHDLHEGGLVDFRRFYTANISLKKSFLGSFRFDSDFRGWGFEDAELGLRLEEKGLKIIFQPNALVQHFHEISSESLESRQFEAGKNAVLFARKHPNKSILPSGIKLLLQKVIIGILPFTFYAQAKKAFLRGIAIGKLEQLK